MHACAGILEPVSSGVDAGVRLGLGKQAQDDYFTNPELIGAFRGCVQKKNWRCSNRMLGGSSWPNQWAQAASTACTLQPIRNTPPPHPHEAASCWSLRSRPTKTRSGAHGARCGRVPPGQPPSAAHGTPHAQLVRCLRVCM